MPRNAQDQFACLVSTMSDVAAGQGQWADVLEPMQLLLGVKASSIEVFDKRTGEMRFLATGPIDPAEQRLYEERIHQVNPRYSLLPEAAIGEIKADRHLDPDIDVTAGEYYEWLTRAAGVRYFAGVKLFDTPDYLGLSSIHVPASRGPIDAATEDMYARLIPHLANALSVHQALAGRENGLEMIDNGAGGTGRAYALLDRDGRVLECSAEFERTVKRSGAVVLRDRRLAASHSPDQPALARLIGSATQRASSDEPLSPIRVHRARGGHGLLLRAIRLNRSRELFARLRPVAMLVLIDLDAPSDGVGDALRSAWGLTPRESELAVLLGEGCRLDRAAALLGMTEQTARTHLKAVFRRMGIDRQNDLVRIVTRLGD